MKIRKEGAYIIKAAEGRSSRVAAKTPPGYKSPVPTDEDKKIVCALLALRRQS